MKSSLRILVAVLVVGLALSAMAADKGKAAARKAAKEADMVKGKIVSLAADKEKPEVKTVVIDTAQGKKAEEVTLKVDEKTDIEVNRKTAKYEDLKVGQRVRVTGVDGKASKIEALSNARAEENDKAKDRAEKRAARKAAKGK